jgi:flagellar hook-length control protein FliK
MGTVRIQMQMNGGHVQAQFHTETQSARTMLNQQIGQLRSVLESQGLSVDRLSVQQMSSSNSNSQTQMHMHQHSQQSADGQTGDGRSRGFFQQGQDQGGRNQGGNQQSAQHQSADPQNPQQQASDPVGFDDWLVNQDA